MLCPYCLHNETKVVDKRDIGDFTKRRRECLKCGRRFNTQEIADLSEVRVIKKDGRVEKFDIKKIRRGIVKACEKRPVDGERIEKMISKIYRHLEKKGKDIRSSVIGNLVARELRKVDKVAYVRFASVYKDFTKLEDFEKEIRRLL